MGSSPLARGLLLFSLPVWVRIGIIPARAGFTAFEASADGKGTDHPRSRGVYAEQSVVPPCQMGSSPLARGLPDATAATPRTTGIIPARAGFTRTSRCEGRRRRDHPRSRGVYGLSTPHVTVTWGSSPLARGLPHAGGADLHVVGIIPARAGFTRRRCPSAPSPRDHPRSRGVYENEVVAEYQRAGSSPLARGLPQQPRRENRCPRIIPARAGFTRTSSAVTPTWADHPRSRGVYELAAHVHLWALGSSPLARGLLPRGLHGRPDRRIIPARAGFTPARRKPHTCSPDHPRSRGVYQQPGRSKGRFDVSSPLARGLPDAPWDNLNAIRIIPARAGFTGDGGRFPQGDRDHPRSRGVYVQGGPALAGRPGSSPLARGLRDDGEQSGPLAGIIPARAGFTIGASARRRPRAGSSPLARGLRVLVLALLGLAGIIPARAGFTPHGRPPRGGGADHPRSCGVYGRSRSAPTGSWGSSPLARGLRSGRAPGSRRSGSSPLARGLQEGEVGFQLVIGIIPARAGFTRPARDPVRRREDHPRSRGVYAPPAGGAPQVGGSSPLARGLRGLAAAGEAGGGIIPARAGFTRRRRRPSSASADHPRSRGVYGLVYWAAHQMGGSSPLARGLHRLRQ